MEHSRKGRVFISYAKEDGKTAKRLYNDLKCVGLNPWLDSEDLIPGQEWETEISRTLKECSFFITLLSSTSVAKRGFIQREQKIALDLADEFPQGEIFIIPVRLEDCELSYEKLRKLQWVDLFPSYTDGFKKILRVLKVSFKNVTGHLGRLHNVPELPPHFLERPLTFANLKAIIFEVCSQTFGVTSMRKIGIHGMGGIGKTVIASSIARDEDIRRCFPDGIFWILLGKSPNLIARQIQLARMISGKREDFVDVQDGKSRLNNLMAEKKYLLVLDDVWEMDQMRIFPAIDEQSNLLITTRNANILKGIGAKEITLDILPKNNAQKLLASWSNLPVSDLPKQADGIIKECGQLPLALSMIGAMLNNKKINRWEGVLRHLQEADLEKIQQEFPNYSHPNLFATMQISLVSISPKYRERYLDFAVFPEDTPIPVQVLYTFWKPKSMDEIDVDECLDTFADLSLVRRDLETDMVTLHELQYDFIRKIMKNNLPNLHLRLLKAYSCILENHRYDNNNSHNSHLTHKDVREKTISKWTTGPNDGYYFEHLCYHLKIAGKKEDLKNLLLNFSWLQLRLEKQGILSLINDFNFLYDDSDINVLHHALKLSAHVLLNHKSHLCEHLHGRLLEFPVFEKLLENARKIKSDKSWIRPLKPCLMQFDTGLLFTLAGHSDKVNAVAITSDGKKAVSGSADKTLKVWDIENGEEICTLIGHKKSVNSVAITADGRIAISGSADKTLKVWDIENGKEIYTISGHQKSVLSVAIAADSKRAVSTDGTLKVWDIENGKEVCSFNDKPNVSMGITADGKRVAFGSADKTLKVYHIDNEKEICTLGRLENPVLRVAITSDGKKVISSCFSSNSIKVWDVDNGKEICSLGGHTSHIFSIAITPDGKRVVSGSADKTLKVWDIEKEKEICTIVGHNSFVKTVAITSDGKKVVSGSSDMTLKIWNITENEDKKTYAPPIFRDIVQQVTPDGMTRIAAKHDGNIEIAYLEGISFTIDSGHTDEISVVAITLDRRKCVSGSKDKSIEIFNFESGAALRCHNAHADEISAIAISPDGTKIISGSWDASIKIRNGNGKEKYTLRGHTDCVYTLAITLDGKKIVSGSKDKSLKIWNAENGKLIHTLTEHDSGVIKVLITPDNKKAISGALDGTLKVWDIEKGLLLANFILDEPPLPYVVDQNGKIGVVGTNMREWYEFQLENC